MRAGMSGKEEGSTKHMAAVCSASLRVFRTAVSFEWPPVLGWVFDPPKVARLVEFEAKQPTIVVRSPHFRANRKPLSIKFSVQGVVAINPRQRWRLHGSLNDAKFGPGKLGPYRFVEGCSVSGERFGQLSSLTAANV
jgi:hypothetical protein